MANQCTGSQRQGEEKQSVRSNAKAMNRLDLRRKSRAAKCSAMDKQSDVSWATERQRAVMQSRGIEEKSTAKASRGDETQRRGTAELGDAMPRRSRVWLCVGEALRSRAKAKCSSAQRRNRLEQQGHGIAKKS